MPEPFDQLAGYWWRFDRYEMKEGYLRPKQGAGLHAYDPWALFRESRTARGADPPYQLLLNLVQGLSLKPRPGPGHLLELAPDDEDRVIGWCQKFGLLGLLPHQTIAASLAPRWEPMPENPAALVATQLHFSRTVEGWVPSAQTVVSQRPGYSRDQPRKPGAPVPTPNRYKSFAAVGAIFRPLDNQRYRYEPFSQTWGRFFVGASTHEGESYPYPAPLSEEFWRTYAEPVYDFVEAARLLLNALRLFQAHQGDPGTGSAADALKLHQAMDAFHGLIETVSPTISPSVDGTPRQGWLATSLLGALAMMALLDLTESRRVMTCHTCRKIFVTKAYQAAYCSTTCRNTAQQRRYRANRKRLEHEGRPSGS